HSALLSQTQWAELAESLGEDVDDPWAPFDDGSRELELCRKAAARLARPAVRPPKTIAVPASLGREHSGSSSTQNAFGRFLLDLAHDAPEVANRVVTVSPDVASSTNLGGWINRVGVWHAGDRIDWFADDDQRLLRWREGEQGQHIELGIAEVNMVSLLAELGSTWSRDGEPLLPIGTLYDPFVTRALEPWSFGIYSGGQSILVATPSGVTLAPEGGAHQSIITPSVGLEQPGCIAWEPAFAQDLEWTLLHALSLLGRAGGESSYFRLTTRALDQALGAVTDEPAALEERRRQVLAGGYPLRRSAARPDVTIVAVGAVVPEALAAAEELEASSISVDVICLTSPDLVYRALRARAGLRA
ncbi:MAG TPA: transketolase C-terminal domain-containing protein, partial [Acidimicrobiales bacterium]|nr:transketolase C-terminal domain-containing protein [Acidimicrobiales bacterium]